MPPPSIPTTASSGSQPTMGASSPASADRRQAPSDKPGPPAVDYNPKNLKFWLVIFSVYLCSFLVALDRLIISTAIPSITNTFNSIQDIGWYGSAYMLTCAIFSPFFGKLYQLYDTKWIYLASIAVFEAGSALCGAAPSSAAFIVGRAIAGAGAAGIFCGAIMVVVPLVPLHKRPLYMSFFGMSFAVSSILGPLIGGTFTDDHKLTWRWCFYVNLPIGGFAACVVFIFLHLPKKPKRKVSLKDKIMRLDPIGLFMLVPSVISLVLALQWGGTTLPWSSPKIIGLLVTFAVLFVAFIVYEFMFPETAMAPRRVVLNRSVGASFWFIFAMYGGMMNAIYYLAIWFQAAQGHTAMQAGIRTIPLVVSLVVCGITSATITQKIGYYVPALILSSILASIGAGLLSTLTPSASKAHWIGFQVVFGLGLGAGGQTSNLVAQTVLPKSDIALGTALNFFVQQLGGSIFLSVGQNIFSRALVKQLSGIAGLDTQAILDTGATNLRKVVPPGEIGTVVNAYSHSLTRIFLLTAALSASMMLGALAVEWRSIKKDANGPPKAGAMADAEKGVASVDVQASAVVQKDTETETETETHVPKDKEHGIIEHDDEKEDVETESSAEKPAEASKNAVS